MGNVYVQLSPCQLTKAVSIMDWLKLDAIAMTVNRSAGAADFVLVDRRCN